VIRNAVIHIMNEQPLLADLLTTPGPADISLICTNLRTMNGKRPVFVDNEHSVFVFPYGQVRFLEVPAGAAGMMVVADGADRAGNSGSDDEPIRMGEMEAMLAYARGGAERPGEATPNTQAETDLDGDLELDEEFLRRIREV
jgi:hypothetical protein